MTESQRLIPMIHLLIPNYSIPKWRSQRLDPIDLIPNDKITKSNMTASLVTNFQLMESLVTKSQLTQSQSINYWIPMTLSERLIHMTESLWLNLNDWIKTQSDAIPMTQSQWLNPKDWIPEADPNDWVPMTESKWLNPNDRILKAQSQWQNPNDSILKTESQRLIPMTESDD
jgi:hypothetical protein